MSGRDVSGGRLARSRLAQPCAAAWLSDPTTVADLTLTVSIKTSESPSPARALERACSAGAVQGQPDGLLPAWLCHQPLGHLHQFCSSLQPGCLPGHPSCQGTPPGMWLEPGHPTLAACPVSAEVLLSGELSDLGELASLRSSFPKLRGQGCTTARLASSLPSWAGKGRSRWACGARLILKGKAGLGALPGARLVSGRESVESWKPHFHWKKSRPASFSKGLPLCCLPALPYSPRSRTWCSLAAYGDTGILLLTLPSSLLQIPAAPPTPSPRGRSSPRLLPPGLLQAGLPSAPHLVHGRGCQDGGEVCEWQQGRRAVLGTGPCQLGGGVPVPELFSRSKSFPPRAGPAAPLRSPDMLSASSPAASGLTSPGHHLQALLSRDLGYGSRG